MGKLEDTLHKIRPLDEKAMKAARARQDDLTKPQGSLGRLEELSIQLAGITGNPLPRIQHKAIITMVGDHGVTAEGVSAFPQEVTAQMVHNFLAGGAGINVVARHVGARVVIVDVGTAVDFEDNPNLVCKKIAHGTRNMAEGPAMTEREARLSIDAGIEVLEDELAKGLDLVGTGDMGIGNTTPSSAIVAVFTGASAEEVTGRGTGLSDSQLVTKQAIIRRALQVNQPDPRYSLQVLARVGGLEIGGIAGVMLGAASHHIPIVVDGFISGAAALIARGLCPLVDGYLIPSHCSAERGHRVMLEYLGWKPILDLGLRLGEGTGAALAMHLVEAAAKILNEMATFSNAGVSHSLDNDN